MKSDEWTIEGDSAPEPLTPGTLIGPYRLESHLGEGGMGTVFKAHDTKLNRPVAVKFLSDDLADAEARRRFQREAQMASSLNHPHILTVYDVGEFGGRQYLVTEFVDGGTLKDWTRAEKRTWRQMVELLTGVADGLATAHNAGILHRDIKPANILVAKNGYAKLADFGLARLSEAPAETDATQTLTEARTRPGTIVGTIAYMSPEQASGQKLDARSDIFSFGIVLYELVAGKRPFSGASELEVLKTIMHGTPEPLGAAVPSGLSAAIEKALEKDPGERYQTMREMVVDLKRLARKTEGAAPPAAIASRPESTTGWWIGAAAFVTAAVVVAALLLHRTEAPDNPLTNALFTKFTDFPGSETDPSISRDGKWIAFRSDRDGPVDTFVSQIGSGRFTNLTHGTQGQGLVHNVGFTPDGSEVWLSGLTGGVRFRLMPLTGGNARAFLTEHTVNAAWSPDGSRIVFHTYDAGDPMFVADSTGAHVQQIFTLSAGRHNHFPTWSPDGQWIYFVSGLWDTREMDLWRIRPSGEPPERLTHLNTDIWSLAPLDNRTILYAAPDQNGDGPWLWAFDTERKVSRRVSTGLEVYQSVEVSADGRRLVAAVSNPTANLWSIPLLDRPAEEKDVKPFGLPTVRAWGPRYGGTSLFYISSRGGGDGLWRYDSGQAVEIWKGADGPLFDPPAVSFDGRHVAVILRKQGRHTLNTLSADGGDLRPMAETIDVSSAASWSPDGKWIVAAGTDKEGPGLFKIPVESGAPVRLTKGAALNPVWSPDGSLIVYTGPAVGVTGPLLMVHLDGSPREAPPIQLTIGGARYRFVPGRQELVYLSGAQISQDYFWLLNLSTMKTRRLSAFDTRATRTFDITPDGKQIVFDRLRENADIVLIDLPK